MKHLLLAAAALALLAAPAYARAAAPTANATAPAEKAKAAPKYDCSKKGNANKAACKDAGAAPAASAQAKTETTKTETAKADTAAAPAKKGAGNSKMKDCAAQWHKLPDAQKAEWKAKGATMKAKKSGKPLNDYQAFSSDCMKK